MRIDPSHGQLNKTFLLLMGNYDNSVYLSLCLSLFSTYLPIDLGVSSKSGLTENPVTDTICGQRYAIRPALHYITLH